MLFPSRSPSTQRPLAILPRQGFTLKLTTNKIIGNGSFGVVFDAFIVETGERVAVKKVLQDRRFKVRGERARAAAVPRIRLRPCARPCGAPATRGESADGARALRT